MTLEAYRSS